MMLPERFEFEVKAFISDVDGCWTDGGMYFGTEGQAMKRFDVKDGYAVGMLAERGIPVIWLTADDSLITRSRADRLKIAELHVCESDKTGEFLKVLAAHGWKAEEVVYMGDDLNDLPVMAIAPHSVCPEDAVAEVKAAATWVCERPGGHGAVREVCERMVR